MHACIKSPEVARRLRGMGGSSYVVDAFTDKEQMVFNARHFRPKGLDFDALCREGRMTVIMSSNRLSNAENRRLVSREIRRQARLTDSGASFVSPLAWEDVTEEMIVSEEKTEEKFYPFDG